MEIFVQIFLMACATTLEFHIHKKRYLQNHSFKETLKQARVTTLGTLVVIEPGLRQLLKLII